MVTLFDHDWQNLSRQFSRQCAEDPPDSRSLTDDEFLDLIEKRAFDFFWYEVHPQSLFVVDSTTWKALDLVGRHWLPTGGLHGRPPPRVPRSARDLPAGGAVAGPLLG